MYYTKEYLKRAHREINTIFRVLFPEHGMAVREEQIMLCHTVLVINDRKKRQKLLGNADDKASVYKVYRTRG